MSTSTGDLIPNPEQGRGGGEDGVGGCDESHEEEELYGTRAHRPGSILGSLHALLSLLSHLQPLA